MNSEVAYEYFVLDSRAQYDIEDAAIYEAAGRVKPSKKRLKRDWGDQGAVLVRAPVISDESCGSVIGGMEFIEVIE